MLESPARDAALTQSRHRNHVRLLFGIGAALPALLFCALAVYSLVSSRAQYEQRAELLTQNLAEALEQGMAEHVDRVDMAVSAIAQLVEIRLRAGELDTTAVADLIQAQKGQRVDLQGLRVIDAQGNATLSRPPLNGGATLNYSDREWFIAHRESANLGLTMSRPLISKLTGQWIVAFSRRYNGPDGRFAGCVSTSVPLSYFQTRLEALDVGSDGFVTLRNTSFELIARKNRAMGVVDAPRSTRVSDTFRQLVNSGQTHATYRSRSPIDEIERTTTMRRLSMVPLIVVVGLSGNDYLSDWYREAKAVAGLSAALLLLYLGGGCVVWRLRRQALQGQARIELLAKIFEHSAEAIVLTDSSKRIIEVNPAFLRESGYRPEEVIGLDPLAFHSPRTAAEKHDELRAAMTQQGFFRGEIWHRTKDGRDYPTWLSLSALRDSQGRVTHYIGSSTNIAEQKEVEDRVRHIAHHDALTQLPNRTLLHDRLEQAMLRAQRDGVGLAMLFIDMDRFKNINDTLGHPVGDSLLVEVGKRLTSMMRDTDIVARLGGDEFVIVLAELGQEAASVAATVARKVIAELGRPYMARGHVLHSTPSIGIGLYPVDGDDADTLLQHADAAMYQAKAAGRNNYQFFTPALNEATAERLALEAGLRGAVERGEMFLHYQPQLDLPSGRVVALEALLRWQHPEMGLVAPMKFIPVAEDTGQIEPIGAWVLDQALQQLAIWRAAGHTQLRVAVNLSAHQLRGETMTSDVAQALLRHDLPGQALELEITESVAMRDPVRTAALLRELRSQGVALAIDDFGTGYSSLAYLKQLPLSCLKLDRSFVTDIESDPNDAAICTATIQLAHSLGLGVVAEGVETQAQLEFLRRLGCDTVQGYLISRPMMVDDCTRFMTAELAIDVANEAMA